jgi:hypothetical protein
MTDWKQITDGIGVALGGDPEQGRALLLTCWAGTAADEHAKRCVLAHYLADTEPAVDDEVAWDEQALAAFADVGAGDLAVVGIPDAAGLAPSLHLNLGDGYLRQHRVAEAQAQLDAGQAAAGTLKDDGYGQLIRGGLVRLAERVGAAAS